MRKMLNTLYVTRQEAYLKKDGLNIVITVNSEEIFRITIHIIEGIVVFSYMGASPGVMKLCVDNNVSLSFLTPNGHFIAHILGPTKGNVLLRRKQYQFSDDVDFAISLSRIFIAGKIQNYRNILRRAIRDNGENFEIDDAANKLDWCRIQALRATDADILRGIE